MRDDPSLPAGVQLCPLELHSDTRGSLVEIFRQEWELPVEPVQWNVVCSEAGTLRGAHVHVVHDDYLTIVRGRCVVGLRDLRPGSPTEGLATTLELHDREPAGIVIPTGVVHGFYFGEPSVHVYAVTSYWSPDDELSRRWDDPELGILWPVAPRLLSERDQAAGSFESMRKAYLAAAGAVRAAAN
jgi:dTDP-4-dehydrorhamnose 3,5-epimerase